MGHEPILIDQRGQSTHNTTCMHLGQAQHTQHAAPPAQQRGRWAMYTDENENTYRQSQSSSQSLSQPSQRNISPAVWNSSSVQHHQLQHSNSTWCTQLRDGQGSQPTQPCNPWQKHSQPDLMQQKSQNPSQAPWLQRQNEHHSLAPIQILRQEQQHLERTDTTAKHAQPQVQAKQPGLCSQNSNQPFHSTNQTIKPGLKAPSNTIHVQHQQQGVAWNPSSQHTVPAVVQPLYERQSYQNAQQRVQQQPQSWQTARPSAIHNAHVQFQHQQSTPNVVSGIITPSPQPSGHQQSAIVSTLSPGGATKENKPTWKQYTAEGVQPANEVVTQPQNQQQRLWDGRQQSKQAAHASNSFDGVHAGKAKNVLKQTQLPFVTLPSSKVENSTHEHGQKAHSCKAQATTTDTERASNRRKATQNRAIDKVEAADSNTAAAKVESKKKPRLSGRCSGKAVKANSAAAKQARIMSDMQQCHEEFGLATSLSSNNDVVINTNLPGGTDLLSQAIKSSKAVVMGVLYSSTVKSQAANQTTQPGMQTSRDDSLSVSQYFTSAQEHLPKRQEKLLAKARKLLTKYESMVLADEDQQVDDGISNAAAAETDETTSQETKAIGIGLVCFQQNKLVPTQTVVATSANHNVSSQLGSEENKPAGPLFYIPLSTDSNKSTGATAGDHTSAALRNLAALLAGKHETNNTSDAAVTPTRQGNFTQSDKARSGCMGQPLLVCADSKSLVRELAAAGVQLDVPLHELNIVDPCVLAWLAAPHLVQQDEKQNVASYCVTCLADYHNLPVTSIASATTSTPPAVDGTKNTKDATSHACESLQALPPLLRLRQGCLLSFQLMHLMVQQVQGWLPPQAVKLEMQVSLLLGVMEARGVWLDKPLLASWTARVKQRVQTLHTQACTVAGKSFNPASALQLAEVLYTHLRLPQPNGQAARGAAKTHAPTDEKALKQLSKHHPLPDIILDYRCMMNVLTRYLQADWVTAAVQGASRSQGHNHGDDVRVHCSWNCLCTATGRLSSSGPNLQAVTKYTVQVDTGTKKAGRSSGAVVGIDNDSHKQQPEAAVAVPLVINVRDAFAAPAGRVLISADYSQIELRVLAHVSGDTELNKLLHRAGPQGDCFQLIAASWLTQQQHGTHVGGPGSSANKQGVGLNRTGLPKLTGDAHNCDPACVSKEERELAKRITYGIIYGLTQHGLQQHLSSQGIDLAQAYALRESFLNHFSGVKAFVERCKLEAKKQGYVTTLMGRRRPLPGLHATDVTVRIETERKVVNSIVQGSAADIMKLAMVHFEQWCALHGKSLQPPKTANLAHPQPYQQQQQGNYSGATTMLGPLFTNQHQHAAKWQSDGARGSTHHGHQWATPQQQHALTQESLALTQKQAVTHTQQEYAPIQQQRALSQQQAVTHTQQEHAPIQQQLASTQQQAVTHTQQQHALTQQQQAFSQQQAVSYAQQGHGPPLLVAQIHDELLVECEDDPTTVMQVAAALHSIMSSVVSLSVPLNVNIFAGRSWGTMEKLEIS